MRHPSIKRAAIALALASMGCAPAFAASCTTPVGAVMSLTGSLGVLCQQIAKGSELAVADFIASHSKVFVLEQNFDAQLTTLLVNEAHVSPASLVPVLHYDGTPITARFITQEIAERVARLNVRPLRENMVA